MEKIDQVIEMVRLLQPNPKHVIYSNKEFCFVFGICVKTAQKWRDKGYVEYTKIGREIFYTLDDCLKMLEVHKSKPY